MVATKILLDTGVRSRGPADPGRLINLCMSPIFKPSSNLLPVYISRETLHPVTDEYKRDKWIPIQAIGAAARSGDISLYTSDALESENFYGYQSLRWNWSPFYAFREVIILRVEEPINLYWVWDPYTPDSHLPKWIETPISKKDRKAKKLKFWTWLASVDLDMLKKLLVGRSKGDESQGLKASLLSPYQAWCTKINTSAHNDDVYHFFVAEYNKLDFFVSLNTSFINAMKTALRDLGHTPSCKLTTPKELIEILGIDTKKVLLPEIDMGYDGLFRKKEPLRSFVPDGDWQRRIVPNR